MSSNRNISVFQNNRLLVCFLFILALLPRIISVFLSDRVLSGNEVNYSQIAICKLEGKEIDLDSDLPLSFTKAIPPVYPLFIAVIYFLTNFSILAVKLMQAILGAFVCLIIFFIAELIFKDRKISFVAALICAFFPPLMLMSKSLLSENIFTFLLALSMLFLLKCHETPNLRNKFFSGMFLGFASLTKPVILAFMPFLFLWFILFFPKDILSRLKCAAIVILFIALTILPWTIRNYIVFKEFVSVSPGGGATFYVYNNEVTLSRIFDPLMFFSELPLTEKQKKEMLLLTEPERDRYLYRLGWEFAKSHSKDFIKIRLISFFQFWHFWPETPQRYKIYSQKKGASKSPFLEKFADSYLLYLIKILYHLPYNILFVGMFISIGISFGKKPEFNMSSLLFLLILSMGLLHSVHGTDRYRVPTDPYVFLLGFHGLLSLWRKK